MKMTPLTVLFGSTLVAFTVILAFAIMPPIVFDPPPSPNAHAYTAQELKGREIYVKNGCVYCHSQDTRPMDWGEGSGLSAQPGDYAYDSPHLVGSERNGPDLFREGGYHSDDWHNAHFQNPRYTRPQSFMPSYSYIRGDDRKNLIAYVQCLGGKDGLRRATQQRELKVNLVKYYAKGPGENVAYLNSTMPSDWLKMPNPEPVTVGSVERGRVLYVAYCAGCHGEHGDGRGSARPYLNPPPMDFTLLQASGADRREASRATITIFARMKLVPSQTARSITRCFTASPAAPCLSSRGNCPRRKSGMSATTLAGPSWAGKWSRTAGAMKNWRRQNVPGSISLSRASGALLRRRCYQSREGIL